MKQSSKRLYSMVAALLLIVVAFLVFFEYIQPAYGDLQTQKGTLLSDQSFLSTEQQSVTAAKNLLTQYESDSQAENNLALAMPSGPDVSGALAQIYGIAENNGISITTIGIANPTVQVPIADQSSGAALSASEIVEPVGTVSFQVNATGSYEDMKSFLSQLETNIRIFDVTAFALQSSAPAAAAGKAPASNPDLFTYSLSVTTYYQLPNS